MPTAILAFDMKALNRFRAPLNSIQFHRLLQQIVLLLIFCSTGATMQAAWPERVNPAHGNCLSPATGVGGTFDLQQNIQYSTQYLKLHRIALAIPCLENARAMDSTADSRGFTVAYDLGLAYLQAGRTQDARTLIENQLKLQDKADLHNLLGTIETKQQHFRAASTQYQLAAQQEPNEQNIFDFAASLLKFQGDSAEQIFRYGIAKYPGSVRLHVGLGSALYAQGQSTQAAEEMCAAARIDPSDPHPMELIGETEQIPPSLATEITDRFAFLVHLYPQNAKLLYYYAMALSGMWSGQPSSGPQTVELLQRALVLDPHLAKAYFYLAQIEEQKKQYPEAMENYRKAAELNPANELYLYRLAFAYKKTGDETMFQKELQAFRTIHEQAKKPE